MENTILVTEDEPLQLESIAGFLSKQGYRVLKAASPVRALEQARDHAVDLVLTDLKMPGMTGVELLEALKEMNPGIDVIVMTAFGTVDSATEAMKLGAIDYLTKPIDLRRLQAMIVQAFERRQLISENRRLRKALAERFSFSGVVSNSSAMQSVMSMAGRVASSSATVLITGETGTGKELVARAVHYAGARHEAPFVAVNCAALPEHLLESELFGHEKGAFTGADKMRRGRFEAAAGGTLFIDEVGEIPPAIQVKLLRVLQERSFERLGSSTPVRCDARIVAATNRDLEAMVHDGTFRSDLYYRLNVVSIRIPPLRERREDIAPLVESCIRRYAEEDHKSITGVSKEAMDLLMKYHYPGNVRELENIVRQAVVLCRSELIVSADLPLCVQEPRFESSIADCSSQSFIERVAAFERSLILMALKESGNVQTRAAESLGISERHLRYKIAKYGLK